MTYILTPNGRRPIVPINESAEQVNDTEMDIDLDVEHFLDYVMENFPELTEKYIEENYEQVDEISRELATRYHNKARKNLSDREKAPLPKDYDARRKERFKRDGRKLGIKRSGDKLDYRPTWTKVKATD